MALFSDILLTVDFDHTMTAHDGSIPQRNLDAVRYFIENGGTFTVNTGRSLPMSRLFMDKVPVNAPFLFYNGSAWYDTHTKQLIQCSLLDLDPAALVEELRTNFPKLYIEIQGEHSHYLYPENAMWQSYSDNNQCRWSYAPPEETGPFLKFALYTKFLSSTISSMYDITPEEEELFRQALGYLQERYGDKIEIFRPCARIWDIHAKGVSKLNSAQKLQKQLGKKILVCVGDGENDVPMLSGADYAFCPKDAAIADRYPNVCPCGEGAVADVIYEKIPAIVENRA